MLLTVNFYLVQHLFKEKKNFFYLYTNRSIEYYYTMQGTGVLYFFAFKKKKYIMCHTIDK